MTAPARRRAPLLLVALALACGAPVPVRAIVGGAPADAEIAAQTVLLVSTRGASCTGTVLAPDLVLTAAHCVAPAADYAVALLSGAAPKLVPVARVSVHPRFSIDQFRTRRPTPDLALVRLAEPLPAAFRAARLAAAGGLPPKGAAFIVAGYGLKGPAAERSAGTLRQVTLANIGSTGDSMVRLSLPEGGAGACTGDSGAPAMRDGAVAGVVSWATGKGGTAGCGGVTGVTLVSLHRDWIDGAMRALGGR